MKKLLTKFAALCLAGAIGAAGFAFAQTVLPVVTAVTGSEVMQNLAVGTAQYFRVNQVINGIQYASTHGTSAPVLSACGTTPTISGTDIAGTVTMGTGSPTGCVITFATAYVTAPNCSVDSQSQLASFAYTVTNAAITTVQTGTSSNKVTYFCLPVAGG